MADGTKEPARAPVLPERGPGGREPARVPVLPARGLRTVLFVALRQLRARKLLNGVALGGVALGVLVLIVMNGILQGFQQKFTQSVLNISPHVTLYDTELRSQPSLLSRFEGTFVAERISHASPSDRQTRIKRPSAIVSALTKLPEVEAAAPSLAGMVMVEYGGKTRSLDLRGIEVSAEERVTPIAECVLSGKMSALEVSSDGIAVGSGVAKDLGLHVGDVVHAAATEGQPLDLKVVAVFESGIPRIDQVRAYTRLRTAQALLGKPNVIGRIEVRLVDPESAVEVADRLESAFGYDAESWQEANANFLSIFRMFGTIVWFGIVAILLVAGFGILAIQVMIVLQKQRDIAILRSVGLRQKDVMRIFLLQGIVISLIGGLLGEGLAKIAIHFLAQLKIKAEGFMKTDIFLVNDDPKMYLYGLAFALLVGVTASVVPAWRAAKVEPVDVLRGQIG